jgi:hypothetical protein
MRDDTPSRTAQWVAGARGLGRLLPEAVRISDDPVRDISTVDAARDLMPPDLAAQHSRANSHIAFARVTAGAP